MKEAQTHNASVQTANNQKLEVLEEGTVTISVTNGKKYRKHNCRGCPKSGGESLIRKQNNGKGVQGDILERRLRNFR